MRIKVTDAILDYEGKELTEQVSSEDGGIKTEPITYRKIFYAALNNQAPGQGPMLPEVKSRAYLICKKIFARGEVDLTLDEASLIKEQVGKVHPPIIYGRVCDLFGEPIEDDDGDPAEA